MPTVHEIESALWELAPRELARSWDNVGLLVGNGKKEVHRVLVALDVTEEVAAEANKTGAELIVAHHPVLFVPTKDVTDRTLTGRVLLRLIEWGIAAVCMHTNLDAAPEGVNDALVQRLGLEEIEPLGDEEGMGRMGLLSAPMSQTDFLALVRKRLRPNGIRYVKTRRQIRRVAVGGGACAGALYTAVERGCDAFVTADVKYHHFLDAEALGLSLIDAGHFPTEDVVCPVLERFLLERFPDLVVQKSITHREVVEYYV